MEPYEVLDIVLKTSDVLAEEYGGEDWQGDIFDFVSASVCVSEELSSREVQDLHKEMNGGSFVTGDSEIFFYGYGRKAKIYVKSLNKEDV